MFVEDLVLSGGLHFDEFVAGGHDEIHVHVGARVFFVAEIEQNFSFHNSHTDCVNEIFQRDLGQGSGFDELFEGDAEADECASDPRSARTSIRLDYVAVGQASTTAAQIQVGDSVQA